MYNEVSYDVHNPEIHCYTFRIMKVSNTWNAEIDTKHTRQRFLSIDYAVVYQSFVQSKAEKEAKNSNKNTAIPVSV